MQLGRQQGVTNTGRCLKGAEDGDDGDNDGRDDGSSGAESRASH